MYRISENKRGRWVLWYDRRIISTHFSREIAHGRLLQLSQVRENDQTIRRGGRVQPSTKRCVVYVGPGGYLTILPAGDPRATDRYRTWQPILTINRPLTRAIVDCAYRWAIREYEL